MELVRGEDSCQSSCHIKSSQWGKALGILIMNPAVIHTRFLEVVVSRYQLLLVVSTCTGVSLMCVLSESVPSVPFHLDQVQRQDLAYHFTISLKCTDIISMVRLTCVYQHIYLTDWKSCFKKIEERKNRTFIGN